MLSTLRPRRAARLDRERARAVAHHAAATAARALADAAAAAADARALADGERFGFGTNWTADMVSPDDVKMWDPLPTMPTLDEFDAAR